MAALTVVAADVAPVKVIEEFTGPVNEAVLAGQYVRLNVTTGYIELGNGSSAGEAAAGGVAVRSAAAGEAVTAVKRGLVDLGQALDAMAYNAPVFVSDTDGTLGDAAGTSSRTVGRVWPAYAHTTVDKLLYVEL